MKRRFSFLADQSGVIPIILGGLALLAFISLSVGILSYAAEGQAARLGYRDPEIYGRTNADPNKGYDNNKAINDGMRGRAIEVAADALNPDDTGISSIFDCSGSLSSPKTSEQNKKAEAKKKNDTKIGETLKKNNLPTGQLTKDVVKGIQKIVETNSKLDADDKTKENVVISIIMQILQDISDNKAKVPVIDTAKQELDNQKILADEKITNTKKQLNRALSEKEKLEKKIAANIADYNNLIAQGYIPENNLSELQERLDYTNKQIAKLDGELKALKQKENEKQGQDDTLSQDSASESTAATEETATGATTAEEEAATEEETTTDEEKVESDLPLTNEDLAGTYSMTVTGMGQSNTGECVISPSGSSGGTIEMVGEGSAAYTFSVDTLTFGTYSPFKQERPEYAGNRNTYVIKFIKSSDAITGKGIMKMELLGSGDKVIADVITFEITMVKKG